VHWHLEVVILLWLILIDHSLELVFFLQVNIDQAYVLSPDVISLHALELVGILAECFSILSEVDFDVGNVAYLVCCQDSENALLGDGVDLVALKSDQVDIGTFSCLITSEFLAEKRHDCFYVS